MINKVPIVDVVGLIDMDGTLCDFDKAMQRDMDRMRSPNEPEFDISDESTPFIKARRDIIMAQNNWWLNLEKYKPGFDVLELMLSIGYQVHVLTRGPGHKSRAWTEKFEWCRTHIPNIPVTLTEKKALVYGKVLVDDWPPYVEGWLEHRPRGLVIMPAQRWNEKTKLLTDCRVVRYDGTNLEMVRKRLQAAYDSMKRYD